MEKSSSLWDIPCGSLPESKNRELMSFGDSNLEAQKPSGLELGLCTGVHSEMLFLTIFGTFGGCRRAEEGRTDWQCF